MHKLKDSVQDKTTQQTVADGVIDMSHTGKVLFQHKIDRLTALLKGTKLDPATIPPKS